MVEQKQDLSFWAFLRACGGEIKKIRRVGKSPAVRGIINFVLWIYAGIWIADVFSVYPAFLPFLVFAILLLIYGMWQQDKEDSDTIWHKIMEDC